MMKLRGTLVKRHIQSQATRPSWGVYSMAPSFHRYPIYPLKNETCFIIYCCNLTLQHKYLFYIRVLQHHFEGPYSIPLYRRAPIP